MFYLGFICFHVVKHETMSWIIIKHKYEKKNQSWSLWKKCLVFARISQSNNCIRYKACIVHCFVCINDHKSSLPHDGLIVPRIYIKTVCCCVQKDPKNWNFVTRKKLKITRFRIIAQICNNFNRDPINLNVYPNPLLHLNTQ